MTCMMLVPSTICCSEPPMRTLQLCRLATLTNLAAARACSPSLLMIWTRWVIWVMAGRGGGSAGWRNCRSDPAPAVRRCNRAVMSTGTTNGDAHVAALTGGVAGQPLVQKLEDVLIHLLHIGLGFQIVANGFVLATEGAQIGLPVGVGQAAHIEHQVRIHRHTTFEAEGLDEDGGPVVLTAQKTMLELVTQLIEGQVAGVDLQA